MKPVIYLPCELKSRDMAAQLLIASHLVAAGYTVVTGQQWALYANASKALAGCYFFKTANKLQVRVMAECRKAGHIVVATDEESMPFAGDGFLVNIDPDVAVNADLFLALNDAQKRVIQARYPALRTITTGNARTDLIVGSTHPRPITERYVLFNTNFALTNSIWGNEQDAIAKLLRGGGIDFSTAAGEKEIQTRLLFERQTLEQLMALIRWCVASLPTMTVVRPHPAENAATWTDVMPGKIKVVAGQSPYPWIAAADLVIHANSTTGLEAAMLDRPCINICPAEFDQWAGQFLMQRVNHTVRSAQEAVDLIVAFFKNPETLRARNISRRFPSHGAAKIAAVLVSVLQKKGAAPGLAGLFPWSRIPRSEAQIQKFQAKAEEFSKGLSELAPGLRFHMHELDDSVALITPA